jgi:hypothetical protein
MESLLKCEQLGEFVRAFGSEVARLRPVGLQIVGAT